VVKAGHLRWLLGVVKFWCIGAKINNFGAQQRIGATSVQNAGTDRQCIDQVEDTDISVGLHRYRAVEPLAWRGGGLGLQVGAAQNQQYRKKARYAPFKPYVYHCQLAPALAAYLRKVTIRTNP